MRRGCRERFPRYRLQMTLLVSDPCMHHDTCVTHVPWCMSGLLTRGGGENVTGIPGACATRNFTYLARCPKQQFYQCGWFPFTRRKQCLLPDLALSQNRDIECKNDRIYLKLIMSPTLSDNSKPISRDYEISQDLAGRGFYCLLRRGQIMVINVPSFQ